jgi:hypothetical protein
MNPYLQTAVLIVTQMIVAAFVYGQLTQRQKDQSGWLSHQASCVRYD